MLFGLLDRDPTRRVKNAQDIKKHKWFRKFSWDDLLNKRVTPPFKPIVKSDDDCRNIDQMFLQESIRETMPMMNMQSFATKQKNHFGNFTYISRQSNVNISISADGKTPNIINNS